MIVTFLPAAGASRRMGGRDKLLEQVEGQPLLRRMAEIALAAGLGPVVVGLGPDHTARRAALEGLDLDLVGVTRAERGLSASLAAGADAARARFRPGALLPNGLLVLMPDMPEVETGDLLKLSEAFFAAGLPVRATTPEGRPGHPVIFPEALLKAFAGLSGDRGAGVLLQGADVIKVPLDGDRAVRDLDTPEAWLTWRRGRGAAPVDENP